VFLGAFLLFQVQPLIGKFILPWFGGTPAVWTTCLLFFQVMLLGGYAYAHGLTTRLSPRATAAVHGALMLAAVAALPVTPGEHWKPRDPAAPVSRILLLLAASVGLPYFVLSATGPLLQAWYARVTGGRAPYRLYALSNAGSLLALISYPFVVEPTIARPAQGLMWSAGLIAFVACCGACAALVWRHARSRDAGGPAPAGAAGVGGDAAAPPAGRRASALVSRTAGTVLLLAVSNKLCQDVAPVPFLWVLPLALYLLSFVIAFDGPRWYVRPLFVILLVLGVGAGRSACGPTRGCRSPSGRPRTRGRCSPGAWSATASCTGCGRRPGG
jgi:hypothetical protein